VAFKLNGRGVDATQLARSPSFVCIMSYLRSQLGNLQWTRSLAELLWALGKVEMQGPDAEHVILHTTMVLPQILPWISSNELCTSLWGLSKLRPARLRVTVAASTLANSIIAEVSPRIRGLTPVCLSTSLCSIIRLGLETPEAEEFAGLCAREIYQGSRDLSMFSPTVPCKHSVGIGETRNVCQRSTISWARSQNASSPGCHDSCEASTTRIPTTGAFDAGVVCSQAPGPYSEQ